jgi:hypothetical protein
VQGHTIRFNVSYQILITNNRPDDITVDILVYTTSNPMGEIRLAMYVRYPHEKFHQKYRDTQIQNMMQTQIQTQIAIMSVGVGR